MFSQYARATRHNVQTEHSILLSNGKIYVVVGVLVIIFTSLAFYLYRIDKKVSQFTLEQREMDS
ncbi:hypothetical protein E0W69_002855 [Rhizosphaericola mali]|uniref:CcmD family protein n=1 Tax=Rhizosphaericola mali TaxID=2545455 RepID=A0A5P2G4Y5_9BACT|nr:hypothetical protein E0W69_002855 [Rhizosphaericola mali]